MFRRMFAKAFARITISLNMFCVILSKIIRHRFIMASSVVAYPRDFEMVATKKDHGTWKTLHQNNFPLLKRCAAAM